MSQSETILESPADKAKRLDVPLIPYFGEGTAVPPPIVSVCGKCGVEVRENSKGVAYSCGEWNCPVYVNAIKNVH